MEFRTVVPELPAELVKGLDVSRYSGNITTEQFRQLKAKGWQFVIVQAWGGSEQNPIANSQISSARQAGLSVAAYCYLSSSGGTPESQVQKAVNAIGADNLSSLAFLAIDVEDANLTISAVQAALNAARNQGLRPIIYTNLNTWKNGLGNPTALAEHPLWEARYPYTIGDWSYFYSAVPFGGWSQRSGWQFAGNHWLDAGNSTWVWCDLNVFLKSDFPPTSGQGQTLNLRVPWQTGQFWVPQTYDGHTPDGWQYAVDFYFASNQSNGGTYDVSEQSAYKGKGQPVLAAHAGTCSVKYDSTCKAYYLEIESGNFKTRYIHLKIKDGINGRQVQAGDLVGWVDRLGCVTGWPHLMFEVWRKDRDGVWRRLDLTEAGPVRLMKEPILTGRVRTFPSGGRQVYRYSSMLRGGYGRGGEELPAIALLSPAEGAVVSGRPRFQVVGYHPDSADVQFKITIWRGSEVAYVLDQTANITGWSKPIYASGEPAEAELPQGVELQPGEYHWEASWTDGEQWSESSEKLSFRVADTAFVRIAGIRFFAYSLQQVAVKEDWFMLPWLKWDVSRQSYVPLISPDGTEQAGPEQMIGRGYWLKASQPLSADLGGVPVTSPVNIALVRGWNAIGCPFLSPVPWDPSAIKVRRGTDERTLRSAVQSGWLEDFAWGWDGSRYVLVYDRNIVPNTQGDLRPWQGYWIYAYQDCELILSPPEQTRGVPDSSRHQVATEGTWTFRLHARAGDATGEVLLGGTKESRDIAIGLPPAPPVGGTPLQVVTRKGGVPLAVDVRADGRSHQPWEIEVQVPPSSNDRATLWWSDVHRVPRQVNPVLVDLQTGERKFLRHSSSHTFAVSREGGTYKFRMELLPQSQLLRITNVRVSGGRSHGSYTISFNINAGAQVEVKVVSAGKVIRPLLNTVTRSAGIQQVSWDGRDSAGFAVPAGAYLVEIKATSVEGQVTRVTVPLVMTR
jgi:GH25 family lysozyme M1 (1,4-beta-N-acetylmuramidase)